MLDLVLADEHALEVAADLEREPARERRVEAVGDRRRLDRDGRVRLRAPRAAPGSSRARRRSRAFGSPTPADDAGDQAAAADRDDDRVGVGRVLLDLERRPCRAPAITSGSSNGWTSVRPVSLEQLVEPRRTPRPGPSPRGRPSRRSRASAAIFCSEAPCHMTTSASTPSSRAAQATPARGCRRRSRSRRARFSSSLRLASLLSAPRGLNEPVRWKSSHLSRAPSVRLREQRRRERRGRRSSRARAVTSSRSARQPRCRSASKSRTRRRSLALRLSAVRPRIGIATCTSAASRHASRQALVLGADEDAVGRA